MHLLKKNLKYEKAHDFKATIHVATMNYYFSVLSTVNYLQHKCDHHHSAYKPSVAPLYLQDQVQILSMTSFSHLS